MLRMYARFLFHNLFLHVDDLLNTITSKQVFAVF